MGFDCYFDYRVRSDEGGNFIYYISCVWKFVLSNLRSLSIEY